MKKSRTDNLSTTDNKEFRNRTGVEVTLAQLLTNLSDDETDSPNIALARHALGAAVHVAAETMMLLYLLEEPCMKALVMAAAQISVKERKRILNEISALEKA